ncbi:glycosyltransferase, partial [Gottfriedia acidiceleris]|uniref:glycosyltransferase n=1 Tax=Gottfriedia acidiceleris TaxID=371036 RepID=UPI003391EF84
MNKFISFLSEFVFWYPLVMSLFWVAGSSLFFRYREKGKDVNFEGIEWPLISILIPCYNEEETIEETIKYLVELDYPLKEIIAVNDGSKDSTFLILEKMANKHREVKAIDCRENRGKANALHIACHASKGEFLVCIDS